MDNNQGIPPQGPGQNPNMQSAQPAMGQVLNQPPVDPVTNLVQVPQQSGGGKRVWLIVVIVALLLLAGGGVYYFMSQQSQPPQEAAIPSPTPDPNTMEALEEDLSSASLSDLEQEFASVDADLQGL